MFRRGYDLVLDLTFIFCAIESATWRIWRARRAIMNGLRRRAGNTFERGIRIVRHLIRSTVRLRGKKCRKEDEEQANLSETALNGEANKPLPKTWSSQWTKPAGVYTEHMCLRFGIGHSRGARTSHNITRRKVVFFFVFVFLVYVAF
jgi:hypothetical protein